MPDYPSDSVRYKQALEYYRRRDILDAMFAHASGRRVTAGKEFQTSGRRLRDTDDLLQLIRQRGMIGTTWPSVHATIARHDRDEGRCIGCDLVLEVDFKSSWHRCFAMTRPIIHILEDNGVPYCPKFSGNASLHLIVPAEAFPSTLRWDARHGLFHEVLNYMKRYVRGAGHLDTSFHLPTHFLRLPYSLNENTGFVSLPLLPDELDSFDPRWADPARVRVRDGWWGVPRDAAGNTTTFLRRAVRPRVLIGIGIDLKTDSRVRRGRRGREPPLVRPSASRMPAFPGILDPAGYERRIRQGRLALKTWQAMIDDGEPSEEDRVIDRFLGYYAREDVAYLMYHHAENRVLSVGRDLLRVRVERPDDIAALAAYAALEEGRWAVPDFRVTATRYDPQSGRPAGHDIVLKIRPGKGFEGPIGDCAAPLAEALDRLRVFYRLQFDGCDGLLVVLPAEALEGGEEDLPAPDRVILPGRILAFARGLCGHDAGRCTVTLETFDWLPVACALDPATGMASLPIPTGEREAWRPEKARVEALSSLPDWPEVTEPAEESVIRLYAEAASYEPGAR